MSKPVEVVSGKLWLTYWPESGRLQVSQIGKTRQGKIKARSVTLDRADLGAEAVDLLTWFAGGESRPAPEGAEGGPE